LHRLQISIDGIEVTHDRARRWRGLYKKSERAIRLAIEAGLRTHVCFTAHRLNFTELETVIDQCAEWGVRGFNLSRFVPTGRGEKSLDLTPREWCDVMTTFEGKRQEYSRSMAFSTHLAQLILVDPSLECTSGFVGCQAGAGQGCIGPCGHVSPCVMLPIVVGNIRDQPLSEIWANSPVLRALRDRTRLADACLDCSLRSKCGGCRAVAYAYTGDYLAADPRCWLHGDPDQLLEPKGASNGCQA
jgi:radical SAM protein with 4Fe4S-binding SPASM domain